MTFPSISARMEALIDEATKPDSKEQVLKDYIAFAEGEIAHAKRMQADADRAAQLLEDALLKVATAGFLRNIEDALRKGSEATKRNAAFNSIYQRGHDLPAEDVRALKSDVLWGDGATLTNVLDAELVKKLRDEVEEVVFKFREYGNEPRGVLSKVIDDYERKLEAAKDMLENG